MERRPIIGEGSGEWQTADRLPDHQQKGLLFPSSSTGSMIHFGWVNINGNRYYFHDDGHAQTGLAVIGGERYFFRTDGSMIRSKWVYYWNSWYFASCKRKSLPEYLALHR